MATTLDVRPVGKHPVLRNVAPFTLANEEVYKNMWQSPKITPLLQTSNAASDSTVAWVGVHPTAKVVCIQPGTSRETHRNPAYRMLVRNAILWTAGRIS
jgi:type 1 glutamine amidotransferase